MNKDGGKIWIISLSIICFILLYSTMAFYVMEESEKGKKIVLQKRFDEVTAVKQTLETQLKEAEMANVELKTRLKTQEETIASITQNLEEAKSENSKNLFKLQGRENEIRGMKTRLANENIEKESLLKKIEKADAECINLKSQLDNILKTREETEKKAKESLEKEGVSLGTIVVEQKGRP